MIESCDQAFENVNYLQETMNMLNSQYIQSINEQLIKLDIDQQN